MQITLFLFGKLADGRDVINTVPAKFLSSPLLFLDNKLSFAKFLVDMGASVSVFPHLPCSHSAPGSGVQLRMAESSPMNTYGSRSLALQFGSRRFEWSFLLANVSMPILSSDFLRHNHLLVNVAGSCLFDSSTLESIPTVSSSSASNKSDLYTALLSTSDEFYDLLSKYPDVISSKVFFTTDPKHSVCQNVPTSPSPLVFAKACRLDAEKLESARKKFATMESAGIIDILPLLGQALYTW